MNTTKTIILMVCLTVLLVVVGGGIAGQQGMEMAFVFASVVNLISYWFSDKIVLRMDADITENSKQCCIDTRQDESSLRGRFKAEICHRLKKNLVPNRLELAGGKIHIMNLVSNNPIQ